MLYLEYDKITREIKRVITSKNRPNDVAHLSYQNVPDDIFVDLEKSIDEIINSLITGKHKINGEDNQESKQESKQEVLFVEA